MKNAYLADLPWFMYHYQISDISMWPQIDIEFRLLGNTHVLNNKIMYSNKNVTRIYITQMPNTGYFLGMRTHSPSQWHSEGFGLSIKIPTWRIIPGRT